jgi:hypothetical protein
MKMEASPPQDSRSRSFDQTVRPKQRSIEILAILACCALSACNQAPAGAPAPAAKGNAEVDYQAPPQVTSVRIVAGQVEIFGASTAGAVVRLARPDGPAGQSTANASGRWVINTPASGQAQLYGVSEVTAGRTLQSSGYLLVTPGGLGVVLRAGAGALVLSQPEPARVTAFDIDRQGGAVVSGFGPPGTRISIRADGDKLGEGRTDAGGRFVLALTGPVNPGRHSLKVFGEAIDVAMTIDASRASALTTGSYRATMVGPHLRVDWMTPGGGEQTTWVYGQETPVK